MIYFPRTLEDFFKKADRQFPALMLAGPRQVGKTTFLKHVSGVRSQPARCVLSVSLFRPDKFSPCQGS